MAIENQYDWFETIDEDAAQTYQNEKWSGFIRFFLAYAFEEKD